jgi:hypothetical protein
MVHTIGMLAVGLGLAIPCAAGGSPPPLLPIVPCQELTHGRPSLSLDGVWQFAYDPKQAGQREGWHLPGHKWSDTARVPGCAQAESHGLAAETGHIAGLKYPCRDPAWFRKSFTIPAGWATGKVFLHFGAIQPAATLWLNGQPLGVTTSSRCPLRVDLTGRVRPDAENVLVARLFWPDGPHMNGLWDWQRGAEGNSFDLGWSGIYRSVWLEHVPPAFVQSLHCAGRLQPPGCTVHFTLGGVAAEGAQAVVEIGAVRGEGQFRASLSLGHAQPGRMYSLSVPMPGARPWSPHSPQLYRARVRLLLAGREIDAAEDRFGLRALRVEGTQVLLNGRPIFLRGGCDDQSYPHTICPPASKEFFLTRLRRAKQYGFNYTKSCVEIFTPEFLQAADEVGILVCQEMPFGLFGETRKLRANPPEDWISMYHRELENIIRSDRNHPCVAFYSMTSELAIASQSPRSFQTFNQDLPSLARRLNPAALVFDVTQTGEFGVDTRLGRRNTDLIENIVRRTKGLRQDPLDGPISLPDSQTLSAPLVLHEYWWWTSLPEPALTPLYQKTPMQYGAVPLMVANARRNGIAGEMPQMVDNSRRLKYALQKDGLELARKDPRIAGYHFWLIHDFHWCPEGIFNEFWEPPSEPSGPLFQQYNGDTVLLLDDGDQRCFACGGAAELGLTVSHYGPEPLRRPTLQWRLAEQGSNAAPVRCEMPSVACGSVVRLASIAPRLPSAPQPVALVLHAVLENAGQAVCENSWTLWAFPPPQPEAWLEQVVTQQRFLLDAYPSLKGRSLEKAAQPSVLVTDKLDPKTLDWIEQGGRLLLLSSSALKRYGRPGDPAWAYNEFYRTVPYLTGLRGNMGTVIHPHPALGAFPHQGWCDLSFVHLISGAYPIDLSPFGNGRVKPILRAIDHYKTMGDKAYLFEVGLGRGVVLACSLKIAHTFSSSPATRYLLDRMLRHLAGGALRPWQTIGRAQLEAALP